MERPWRLVLEMRSVTFWRIIALFVPLCALTFDASPAQSYSGALVQQLVVSPRIQGLGEATVGLRGYAGAAQLNPAAIGRSDVVQGSTAFHPGASVFLKTPWLPAVFAEFTDIYVIAPSVDVKLGAWAFGYMYREMSFGEFEVRDAQNNPQGTYRSYDSVHKLTAAYDVLEDLAVGISINFVASKLGAASVGPQSPFEASAFSVDLGLLYGRVFDLPHVRVEPGVAWSLTDFGSKLDFQGQASPLPLTMRSGVAVELATQRRILSRPLLSVVLLGAFSQEIEQVELEETVDGGTQPDFKSPFVALFTGWKPLRVQTSWSGDGPQFENVSVWRQMRRHAGIELALWDVLFLRLGTQYEHPQLGTRDFSSNGWGIDLYYVAFERTTVKGDPGAYRDFRTSTLTVRVPLRHTPDNFWIPLLRRFT